MPTHNPEAPLKPAGKTTLHLGDSPAVANHFLAIANAIRA